MKIVCPHCSFSREVPEEKVPDRPVKVTCPKCQQGFSFDKTTVAAFAPEAAFGVELTGSTTRPVHTDDRTVCPACGLEQPDDESCSGCGVVYAKWTARQEARVSPGPAIPSASPRNEAVFPGRAAYAAATDPATLPKAGFWVRVGASLIDGLILGAVQFGIGLVLGFAGGAAGGEGFALFAITWLCSVAVSITYYVFFTGYNGQTPGKMALRLQVIRCDGMPVGYGKAFLREIPCKFISGILLGIGYLMVAFDQQKQGLHDRMAGTYVVKL